MGYGLGMIRPNAAAPQPDAPPPAPYTPGVVGDQGAQPSTVNYVDHGDAIGPNGTTAAEDASPYPNITNPNAYYLGGYAGGAQADTDRYRGMSAAAEGRQGVQQDNRQYGADREQEMLSRSRQQFGLGNLRDTIEGRGPSVADAQGRIAFQNAAQTGAGIAAGGHGGGGNLAAAHRLGAQQSVGGATGAGFNAALGRGAEVSTAQGHYIAAANAQRAQDLQRQGLSLQQATSQAQLEAQQRAQNDARSMGLEQLGQSGEIAQLGASQAEEAQNAKVYTDHQNYNAAVDAATKKRKSDMTDAAIGVVSSGGTAGYGALAGASNEPDAAKTPDGPSGASDRRVKENIKDGSAAVHRMLEKLGHHARGV